MLQYPKPAIQHTLRPSRSRALNEQAIDSKHSKEVIRRATCSWPQCNKINKRGWEVQERAYAPRALYYDSNKLHWECIESYASESHPTFVQMSLFLSLKLGLGVTLRPEKTLSQETFSFFWWRLLANYTIRKLTYASDKWHVVSDLAQLVQQRWGQFLVAAH